MHDARQRFPRNAEAASELRARHIERRQYITQQDASRMRGIMEGHNISAFSDSPNNPESQRLR
jgi:hypothetical protein